MSSPRACAAMGLLLSGRVTVAGGRNTHEEARPGSDGGGVRPGR